MQKPGANLIIRILEPEYYCDPIVLKSSSLNLNLIKYQLPLPEPSAFLTSMPACLQAADEGGTLPKEVDAQALTRQPTFLSFGKAWD